MDSGGHNRDKLAVEADSALSVGEDDDSDKGLNKLVWMEAPEEEYLRQILKEEENRQRGETSKHVPKDPVAPSLEATKSSSRNSWYDDLPNAIKLMVDISVNVHPMHQSRPKSARNGGALEKIFGVKPATASASEERCGSDEQALGEGLSYLPDDLTVNQLIQQMEQEEENDLFGAESESEKKCNENFARKAFDSSIFSPIRRSLLPAMNAGSDDTSTNESLAGQNTVNDIVLKMVDGEDKEESRRMDRQGEKAARRWTDFNPIARSVFTQDLPVEEGSETSPSTVVQRQEATADIVGAVATTVSDKIALQDPVSTKKKTFFVDDDTSVGSINDKIEVVFKRKPRRNYDQEKNDGATFGNLNTVVSSLSHDETYFKLGHQPPAVLPVHQEESQWCIGAEKGVAAGIKAGKKTNSINGTPKGPDNSVKMKQPMTPSTHNSELLYWETLDPPFGNSDSAYTNDIEAAAARKKATGSGNFLWQSLRASSMVRCLVLLSAIFFAAFVGLGVTMLMQERSPRVESGDMNPVGEESPPPFLIEVDGSNITFDSDGMNSTAMLSPQPAETSEFPAPSPTATDEENGSPTQNEMTQRSSSPSTGVDDDLEDLFSFPLDDYTRNLLATIRQQLPESTKAMSDSSSPQYRALQWIAFDATSQSMPTEPLRIMQRWVLAVLFYSMGGEGWVNSLGWLSDTNECQWVSTSTNDICGTNSMLAQLDLRRNGLKGSLPVELILLAENLESIQVNGNSIEGTVPAFVADLKKLGRLHLNGNLLTGTIPSSLGQLSATLWSLRLGQMDLNGPLPSQLGSLSQLTYLFLANNRLTGTIPSQFGNLSNLLELELFDNQLIGTVPTELGFMTSLISLKLQQNLLEGSVDSRICTSLGAPEETIIQVECSAVSCSCCQGCR